MMKPQKLTPARLLVRCVAERKGDQWQAFSLEFGLAAQADSFPAVKKKLDSMILEYLTEALTGADREHASVLLRRRATARVYAKYHAASALNKIRSATGSVRVFQEPVGFTPSLCAA